MNHISKFSIFESSRSLNNFLKSGLDVLTEKGWSLNSKTGKIDVKYLDIWNIENERFPKSEIEEIIESLFEIGFGECTSSFNVKGVNLKTLKGSPQRVGGYFDCRDNNLTTLEGGPRYVGGSFYCSDNPLENLKGSPDEVGYRFSFPHSPSDGLGSMEGLTPLENIGNQVPSSEVVLQGGHSIRIIKEDLTIPNLLNLYRLSEGWDKRLLKSLVTPEEVQKYIDENPEESVTGILPKIWNQVVKLPGYENLSLPSEYKDEFDDIKGLSDLGF
jgi:hypothetical protein